jgi:DNA-binding response OmpR family regulator
VRSIQLIRKDASGSIGGEVAAYHLGIFFQAASRLTAYNPDAPMRDKELAPFAHLLLAMCMIGGHLRDKRTQISLPVRPANPIQIDKENRMVLVEGVPLTLKGKGYQLLCFLYDRAGRLCDRKELVEAVFDETYDATDESQQSKLNTAIHRLRERIEDDAEDPQYLVTAPGGYRLVIEERKINA